MLTVLMMSSSFLFSVSISKLSKVCQINGFQNKINGFQGQINGFQGQINGSKVKSLSMVSKVKLMIFQG